MAGRGTDIKLNAMSRAVGGLVVLGSERHESRRIDNQLRGRSGRQGDPGRSQFYVSMEDDIVKRFGGGSIQRMMLKTSDEDDTPIRSKSFSKAMTTVQKRAEGYNFDSRKNVLDYDDVLRRQREIVYKERDLILEQETVHDKVRTIFDKCIDRIFEENILSTKGRKVDILELCQEINMLGMPLDKRLTPAELEAVDRKELQDFVKEKSGKFILK